MALKAEAPPQFESSEVLTINRDGDWFADGQEITHQPTLQAFKRHLFEKDGEYFIRMGREQKKVEVEDTAWFIECAKGSSEEGFELRVSDGRTIPLDPARLELTQDRFIHWIENPNQPGHLVQARFVRQAYYDVLRFIEGDTSEFYLLMHGQRIRL